MSYLLTWVDADGGVTPFDASLGIREIQGALGLDVAPVDSTFEDAIGTDGAVLVATRRGVRQIAIPLHLTDIARTRDVIATLARITRDPGTLRFTEASVQRELRRVVYAGGLEGNQGKDVTMPTWRRAVLSLLALDPLWYGEELIVVLNSGTATPFDDAGTAFDSPTTPFDGGAATPQTIQGDDDAFPVFTVTGPYTTLVVGVAGGESWQLAAPLAAASTITVDSRPGMRGPALNGAAVDWSLLTAASRLFTLEAGITSLVVGSTGSTGASSVVMAYEPRFLSP